METWPTDVPYQVAPQGWRLDKPFRDAHRTSMEDGPRRARRSSTKRIATISITLIPFTRAQFETFKAWVEDDLDNGTLPAGFTMPVWTGSQYANRTCHFINNPPYDSSAKGPYVGVSMTLDVEDL